MTLMQIIKLPGEKYDIGSIDKAGHIFLYRTTDPNCTAGQELLMECLSDNGIYPTSSLSNGVEYKLKHVNTKKAVAAIKTSGFYVSE